MGLAIKGFCLRKGARHNIINLRGKGKPTILETGDLWRDRFGKLQARIYSEKPGYVTCVRTAFYLFFWVELYLNSLKTFSWAIFYTVPVKCCGTIFEVTFHFFLIIRPLEVSAITFPMGSR
jgi:hypothetical protein